MHPKVGACVGRMALHDNPLVVGETTVQSRHITELRDAINGVAHSSRTLGRRGKRPNPSLPTAAWESQAKKQPDFPTFPQLLLLEIK